MSSLQNRKFREEVKKAERLTEENKRIDMELQKKTSILSNLTEVSGNGRQRRSVYLPVGCLGVGCNILFGFIDV